MSKQRRTFSPEFKQQAACLVLDQGYSHMEAGRGKGSIKKSRIQFAELIKCIDEAAIEQRQPRLRHAEHATRTKQSTKELQAALDAALARELSLVLELFELRKTVAKLTGDKLYPIRRR
jgi:transposase-like protein